MLLKFRIETLKVKQPRIAVLRMPQKGEQSFGKQLGSFSSKRDYEHIVKQLTPEELYEFENFVKVMDFSKSLFNRNVDTLDRFIIKAPPELKESLVDIWKKAKEYNIDFVPEHEMLLAVLNRAKIVEQQLNVLTEGKFKKLRSFGIDIENVSIPKQSLKESQKLINAVIENSESLESLADIFNEIASKIYQKTPKFKAHHLEYLTKQSEQGQKQPFPKWYYTIAIDALTHLGVEPDAIVSPALITEHWLRLNQGDSLESTQEAFKKRFKRLKANTTCLNIIKKAFVNDELLRMDKSTQGNPVPSLAIENWLRRWKEKNPKSSLKEAIKFFNNEFKVLSDNPFFINIINKFYNRIDN